MSDNYIIRQAYLDDMGWICSLERLCFPCPWSRPQLEWLAIKRGVRMLAVGEEASLVYRKWGCKFHVYSLATHPKHRGRGMARALMDYAITLARKEGFFLMFLEVACDNAPAITLYENLGFVVTNLISDYYGKSKHAYEMVLIGG